MKKSKYLIIQHHHTVGGQLKDRMFWTGIVEGETDVWDYGLKHQLKQQALDCGMGYKVLRWHRNGEISIIEQHKPISTPQGAKEA